MNIKFQFIYPLLSLLVAIVVLSIQPKKKTVLDRIENQLNFNIPILKKKNAQQLKTIENQANTFPEYFIKFEEAKQIDAFTKAQFLNISKSDLIYFSDSLRSCIEEPIISIPNFSKHEKEIIKQKIEIQKRHFQVALALEEEQLIEHKSFTSKMDFLINTSNYQLTNVLKTSQILTKQTRLNNYFISKTRARGIACFTGAEVYSFLENDVQLGDSTNLKIMLTGYTKRNQIKNHQIWVNDKPQPVRNGKATIKAIATKSGWNEVNFKITADYGKEQILEEQTFRYFVCE